MTDTLGDLAMFSNFFKRQIIFAFLLFFSIGCSLKINEDPPEAKPFDFKGVEGSQCLAEVLPTMSEFVKGTAKAENVDKTWECFGKALTIYSTLVRGQNEDRYLARELAKFFEDFYLDDIKISDRLLAEIMELKQIIVGGNAEYITRDELKKLVEFSNKMRGISLKILPYMQVFSLNWKVSGARNIESDIKFFENANLEIQDAAKSIAAIVEINNHDYSIEDFVVLLDELSALYKENWSFVDKMRAVLPLVYKLKKSLAGGSEQLISAHEWRRFLLLGARGYIQYLRYHYFIKNNDELGAGTELVYLAKSFDDLFSYLGDMVAEKPEGVFTRQELVEVFQSLVQFLPSVKISDALVYEIMKFKKLLFGGNLDYFTPEDFWRAKDKVQTFRNLTEQFMTHLSIYSLSWRPQYLSYDESQKTFKRAEVNLTQVSQNFGKIIEDSYDLKDLRILISEFEKLYGPEGIEDSFLKTIKEFMPLIITSHQVLFSTKKTLLTKDQWPSYLDVLTKIYARGMYYYYFLNSNQQSLNQGVGLESFKQFIQDSRNLVDFIIDKKPKKVVTFAEIKSLIDGYVSATNIQKEVDTRILYYLTEVLLKKILISPEDRIAGRIPGGLTLNATRIFISEFTLWYQVQFHFDRLYKKLPPGVRFASAKRIIDSLQPQATKKAFFESYVIYNSPLSRAFDDKGKLHIAPVSSLYSFESTNTINLVRVASRLIMRSYSQSIERINKYQGLKQEEAQAFYLDIKPLLVALNFIDVSNNTFAESRFREANLFLARSDGNNMAGFAELADLSIHIISGLKIHNEMKAIITNPKCCPVYMTDNIKMISVNCLIEMYYKEMDRILTSMPMLSKFMLSLPRCPVSVEGPESAYIGILAECGASFDQMIYNIVKSAGYIPNQKGLIPLGISSYVPHVMQYIESMMQRFDDSKDGILNNQEAAEAYPVFKSVLANLSGYEDDKTLMALLAWIMQYGRPPESNFEKIKFYLYYKENPDKWKINTDREKLASILGFIADAINRRLQFNLNDFDSSKISNQDKEAFLNH